MEEREQGTTRDRCSATALVHVGLKRFLTRDGKRARRAIEWCSAGFEQCDRLSALFPPE